MIIKYISEHLDLDLSMERLAEEFYISASYLRKIFKKETNTTIKEYITDVRMAKATELLQKQDMKISDIASSIGYLSTTAFKLYTGKTPGEYRTQCVLKAKS